MRFGAVSAITWFMTAGIIACVPKSPESAATIASGGSTTTASGGATKSSGGAPSSNGGNASAGGVASGGTGPSGGLIAAGGSSSGGASSGGASSGAGNAALGGTLAAGGSPQTSGNCTDTPPPNQTPTCPDWAAWNTCSADWFKTYCDKSCGRCSGTSPSSAGGAANAGGAGARGGAGGSNNNGGANGSAGGSNGSAGGSSNVGGSASPGSTNPPITGSNGFATRYWDCCKPSCSWTTSVPSCGKDGTTRITDKNAKSGCDSGGSAFECYDFSPWFDASTNLSYGFAAHNGVACGSCFMLQFTGEGNSGANAGASALKGQQMIVQAINIGGIDSNQFDILIPGGGVGAMTNGCSAQWGSSTDFGSTYGGLLSECKNDASCMKGKCDSVFGKFPALLAGCNWFTGWYSSADNPKVIYKKVSCPSQITSKSGISG